MSMSYRYRDLFVRVLYFNRHLPLLKYPRISGIILLETTIHCIVEITEIFSSTQFCTKPFICLNFQ